MKEYIREGYLIRPFPEMKEKVFDPIDNFRGNSLRTAEDKHWSVDTISVILDDELNSDSNNRERVDKSLLKNNIPFLVKSINTVIKDKFSREESRKQAGTLAELYVRSLQTFRTFEQRESSRATGDNKFNKSELLDAAGDHREACLKFSEFVQHRNSQDIYRFATSSDSNKRLS